MARGLSRGQVWMYRFRAPDKRRPVLILSRDEAIENVVCPCFSPLFFPQYGRR